MVISVTGNGRNRRYTVKWPNNEVDTLTIRALEVIDEVVYPEQISIASKISDITENDNSYTSDSDDNNTLDFVDEEKQ